MALPMFRKLRPQRPTVIRIGDSVKTCYYYEGTKQCLGNQCFWPRVGKCGVYNRLVKSGKIRVPIRAK